MNKITLSNDAYQLLHSLLEQEERMSQKMKKRQKDDNHLFYTPAGKFQFFNYESLTTNIEQYWKKEKGLVLLYYWYCHCYQLKVLVLLMMTGSTVIMW